MFFQQGFLDALQTSGPIQSVPEHDHAKSWSKWTGTAVWRRWTLKMNLDGYGTRPKPTEPRRPCLFILQVQPSRNTVLETQEATLKKIPYPKQDNECLSQGLLGGRGGPSSVPKLGSLTTFSACQAKNTIAGTSLTHIGGLLGLPMNV